MAVTRDAAAAFPWVEGPARSRMTEGYEAEVPDGVGEVRIVRERLVDLRLVDPRLRTKPLDDDLPLVAEQGGEPCGVALCTLDALRERSAEHVLVCILPKPQSVEVDEQFHEAEPRRSQFAVFETQSHGIHDIVVCNCVRRFAARATCAPRRKDELISFLVKMQAHVRARLLCCAGEQRPRGPRCFVLRALLSAVCLDRVNIAVREQLIDEKPRHRPVAQRLV